DCAARACRNPNNQADRPVIIGGIVSGINSLKTLKLPIIPTSFRPFIIMTRFTHQGATWVDPSPPMGRVARHSRG
ncbi:MAG: hypothetical protein U5J78_06730, partial [Parasphingorhabdus sp.]|nr:hypothetical protein [Parasphingorhabdus sp.]